MFPGYSITQPNLTTICHLIFEMTRARKLATFPEDRILYGNNTITQRKVYIFRGGQRSGNDNTYF